MYANNDDKKKKILFLISRLDNAGPVNMLYNLLRNMMERDYNVEIITLFPEQDNSRICDFINLNIKISQINIKSKWNLIALITKIKRLANIIKPEIIHSMGLPADLVALFLKSYVRITTLHCNIYVDYKYRWKNKILAIILIKVHEYCIKKLDCVICCSITIKEEYMKKIHKTLDVIQNGVNIEKFCQINEIEKSKLRKKLLIEEGVYLLVVVGSLDMRKDPITIIDAYNRTDIKKNSQLIFVGQGQLLKECIKRIDNPNIEFRGQIENVTELLQCADAYISASKSEGLPMSVLEAGAVGLKLILSKIQPHEEIFFKEGGNHCVQFFCNTHTAELTKILNMIDIEGETDKNRIAQYFQENYSDMRMTEDYMNIYMNYMNVGAER